MLTIVLMLLPTADATPAPSPTADMKPIAFLAGSWKGTGWVQTREDRPTFTIQEKIEPKLDGSVFLVEGIGKDAGGKVHHHALAFFHFDKQAGHFKVKAFRKDGGFVDAKGEMKDGAFVWGFDPPQGRKVRFTLKLNDKGQWVETGEFTRDGKEWMKMLEMTLDRVKE
jgi:hypothetical protein